MLEDDAEQLFTVRQAAVELGTQDTVLRAWIRKGALRVLRIGPAGLIRIQKKELMNVIKENSYDFNRHPKVRQAREKLEQIEGRFREAENAESEFARNLAAIAREIEDLEVKVELNDVPKSRIEEVRARRRQLEQERQEQRGAADRLRAATSEQERRVVSVENEARAELRPKALSEVKLLAQELAPLLRQAAAVNARLNAVLHQAGLTSNPPVFALPALLLCSDDRRPGLTSDPSVHSEISRWFRLARESGFSV